MEEDKLFYYSKSANKQAGKGVNEFVSNYNDYNELNKIKDWRKMLSNFYVAEFTYNGKTYYTAEHAFQAKKIEIVDAAKANLINGYPLRIDNNRKLLDNVSSIAWNNLPLDTMEVWTKQVEVVSLEQVKAAFQKYLAMYRMKIVVLGAKNK